MADEQLERLIVSLEARMKSYETTFNKALGLTDKRSKQIEDRVEKMSRQVTAKFAKAGKGLAGDLGGRLTGRAGAIGGALEGIGPGGYAAAAGIGAAALGLTVFYTQGKAALQVADAIGDSAAQLNVTAEGLQSLRFAFNGLVDAETVDGAIGKLSKTIGEASLGNKEAAGTFKSLGVDIKDSGGNILPTEAVLRAVADRIAALKSPAQQAALAAKLFGKEAGTKLLPVLQQGGRAFDDAATRLKALGGLMSNETVAQAGDLQQKLDDLSVVVRSQLTQGFVQAGPQIVAFTQLMADKLPAAIETTAKVVKFLADNLELLSVALSGVAGARLGALIGTLFGGIGAPVGALIGAFVGAGGAALAFAADTETAAGRAAGAVGTITAAEQGHIDKLNNLRDAYYEVKDASEAKQKAVADEAVAGIRKDEAAALAPLQQRRGEVAQQGKDAAAQGNARGGNPAVLRAQREAEDLDKQIADVKAHAADLIAAATGTEHVFDPITAGLDELVAHLGHLNPQQISEMQAAFVAANIPVQELVKTYNEADQQFTVLADTYAGLAERLADVTGWDAASQTMVRFLQGAKDIQQQLIDGTKTTGEADAAYKHLMDQFGVPVSAAQLVGEIGKIEVALQTMGDKAKTAFTTLGEKLGNALRTFALTGAGTVVPDNAGIPRPRGTPPPVRTGGGVTLPGGGGGGGAKAKKDQENKLDAFMATLREETKVLGLDSAAQKENELLVRAAAAAKEDFKNKVKDSNGHLRDSAKLTADETKAIKAHAAAQAAVPDIVSLAADKLPQFKLQQELKTLAELQAMLADPAVAAGLAAAGLSAADAARAIALQIAAVKDEATGTSEAISGLGDAFISGIQGAQTFEDAVWKIVAALGEMLVKAALFGGTSAGGPLGKSFDSIFGLVGGLVGSFAGAGGGGPNVSGAVPSQSTLPRFGSGGTIGAGQAAIINDLGREAARRGGDLFIPGQATQIIPASATRRLGGGFDGGRIELGLTVQGSGDKELMANMAAGAQHIMRQGLAEYDRRLLGRVDEKRARIG